jgi:hypothetical protein
MPQYYAGIGVTQWVKCFITESFEGALCEEQKKDIPNFFRNGDEWLPRHRWGPISWEFIAVPFGIEDAIGNEILCRAIKNTFLFDVDEDDEWMFELQELFEEEKEDEEK